jgi:hypothetical protein
MRDESNADLVAEMERMLGPKGEEDGWFGVEDVLPSIEDDSRGVGEKETDPEEGREDSETLGGEKGVVNVMELRQSLKTKKIERASVWDEGENFWNDGKEKPKQTDTLRRIALGGLGNGIVAGEQQTPITLKISPPSTQGTPASGISLYDENGFFKDL